MSSVREIAPVARWRCRSVERGAEPPVAYARPGSVPATIEAEGVKLNGWTARREWMRASAPNTAFRRFVDYGARPGTGWLNWAVYESVRTSPPFHPGLCAPHLRCASWWGIADDE